MKSLWPAFFISILYSWNAISASPTLSCRLKCSSFECNIPQGLNLTVPFILNSTFYSYSKSLLSTVVLEKNCSTCSNKFIRILNDSFQGIHIIIFHVLTIRHNNEIVFRDKPCIYEQSTIKVNVTSSAVSVTSHLCHYEEQSEIKLVCRSEDGAIIEQTYFFKDSTTQSLTGLQPFTKYNCSIHKRYMFLHESNCISKWSDGGFSLFKTDPQPPSAAPVLLGFIDRGIECHVYFQAVPPNQLNGNNVIYKWKCGDMSSTVTTRSHKFRVDCASPSCVMWAENEKGKGPTSRALVLASKKQRPSLQLWSKGSDIVEPRAEDDVSAGRTLLICTCGKCESDLPTCTSLTTRPLSSLKSFRVDLKTHRVALLQNDSSGPVMSDWVSCSYEPGSSFHSSRQLTANVTSLGAYGDKRKLQVDIPTTQLNCPRTSKPIYVIVARLSCPLQGYSDRNFSRISEQKDLIFAIELPSGCELYISDDNENFVKIYSRKHSPGFPSEAIVIPVLAITAIFVITFMIYKYRRQLLSTHRKLWEDPRTRTIGDIIPEDTMMNYHYAYAAMDSGNEYATQTDGHKALSDSGVCMTAPSHDYSEESSIRDGYTEQII